MGLLGGFKGKLIGKAKKEKDTGKGRIVCVKFNTFSEFDSPNDVPSCSNTNPGRNEVIKERRRPTKPEIKSVFENGRAKANGDVKATAAPPPPKAKANLDVKPTPAPPPKAKEDVKPTPAAPPPKAKANSDVNATAAAPPPKAKAPQIPPPKETVDPLPSPVIMKESKLFAKSNDSDSDSDDGNFKIHIAPKSQNLIGGLSDDESSIEEHEEAASPVNYSSQATSIFFGEDEEPVVRRPRNFVFNDGDDDVDDNHLSDSSASA